MYQVFCKLQKYPTGGKEQRIKELQKLLKVSRPSPQETSPDGAPSRLLISNNTPREDVEIMSFLRRNERSGYPVYVSFFCKWFFRRKQT
ncbi:hypothetical protein B9Z55_027893 [Caenorhabditis nigoni]|uniref:Uncharacterized protein n=1 Tax=Caenorhabditis nigoni TaxID=1611254 RepID=A0A2G5SE17_9PELO|nr:hypothetical protein B9Z55_027893 [Caenorhabditis nigoni]